jgi:hypothetical protein
LFIIQVPLYGLTVGVWFAVNACKIIGSMFLEKAVYSDNYIQLILMTIFRELIDKDKMLMQ